MTIANTNAYAGPYTPNGVTTVFPFAFKAFSKAEIRVFTLNPNGGETEISQGLYTATVNTNGGGSVTISPALPNGTDPLFIESNPLFTQSINFENQSAFRAPVHTEGLDRSAAKDIWLRNRIRRTLLLPPGEVQPTLPLAINRRGGKVLGFNSVTGLPEVQGAGFFKGDPGGDTAQVGTLAQAVLMNITGSAPGKTRIMVTDRGFFDLYVGPALDAAQENWSWFRDAGNAIWRVAGPSMFEAEAFGLHADGTSDNAPAIAKLRPGFYYVPPGILRIKSQFVWPDGVVLCGAGYASEDYSVYTFLTPATIMEKDIDGPIKLAGNHGGLHNMHVTRVAGRTGDLLSVRGSRVEIGRVGAVSFSDAERDALRIGTDGTMADPYVNANAFYLGRVIMFDAARHALNIDQSGGIDYGSTAFPLGATDVNGGVVDHIIAAHCDGNAVNVGNSITNQFGYVLAQDNGGYALYFERTASGHVVEYCYSENNTGDYYCAADTTRNELHVRRSPSTGMVGADLGTNNDIGFFNSAVGTAANNSDSRAGAYIRGREHVLANLQPSTGPGSGTGPTWYRGYANSDLLIGAHLRFERSGASGTKAVLAGRAVGGAELDRFVVDGALSYFVNTTALTMGRTVSDTTTPGMSIYGIGAPRIDFVGAGTAATTLTANYNGNGFVGGISMSGTATIYATSSDRRLKKSVKPLDGALEMLARLKPVTFVFKRGDGERRHGFIADEVQEVVPQAVVGEKDGKVEMGDLLLDSRRFGDVVLTKDRPREGMKAGDFLARKVVEDEVPLDAVWNFVGEGWLNEELEIVDVQTVLARDVVKPPALPEGVSFAWRRDGNWYQGLDHSMLIPLLVAALQELAARVSARDV